MRELAFQSIWRCTSPFAVLAQVLELEPGAAPAPLEHADLREPVVGGEQRVARDRLEVRVDLHPASARPRTRAVPEAQRGRDAELAGAEAVVAARQRRTR
jgi:hypothetical protein